MPLKFTETAASPAFVPAMPTGRVAPQVVSPQRVNVLFTNNNAAGARTHGFELAADWRVSSSWCVLGHHSGLYVLSPRPSELVAAAAQDQWAGRVPRHRASLRSSRNLQGDDREQPHIGRSLTRKGTWRF